jgi:hypothetical protein
MGQARRNKMNGITNRQEDKQIPANLPATPIKTFTTIAQGDKIIFIDLNTKDWSLRITFKEFADELVRLNGMPIEHLLAQVTDGKFSLIPILKERTLN